MQFFTVSMIQFLGCFRLILVFALIFQGANAFAVADVIGTAGDFSRSNSQAALANRSVADKLYKQALADHDRAWSSFPPNVGLLSKSLAMSKDAKAADDQAKEFARGAMHGVHTAGTSGDFALKKYGIASEKELDNLANGSSPYMPAAEKTLGKYGMKLTSDKMSIKTPLGTLPLDMSITALEKGLRGVASGLGYNPDDVSRGLAAAAKERDNIAAQAMASLAKDAAKSAAAAGSNGSAGLPGPAKEVTEAAANSAAPAAVAAPAVAAATQNAAGVNGIDPRQEELQRNRAQFLKTMGIKSGDPLGASHQDIFKMVHLRYQSLRSEGEFFEGSIAELVPVIKPLAQRPPAVRVPASNGPIQPFIENGPMKSINQISKR